MIHVLNRLVSSRDSYGRHAWRRTRSEISSLSILCNQFLRSIVEHGFERVKYVDLDKDHSSPNLVDWRYTIQNKELYQITETASQDFRQLQKLKWIS